MTGDRMTGDRMNERPRDPDPGQPPSWRDYDDTLADGPAATAVPPEVQRWLAEQRTVHGLLRALHTADAAAREARITALLERIDAQRAAGAPARHWRLVALAGLLLAAAAIWFALPARLPTADAAVSRAVAELARDVNRRFGIVMTTGDRSGKEVMRHEVALVTRPGLRFRVDGKFAFAGMQVGEMRLGCDGTELWVTHLNGLWRHAVPVAERERLLQGFGDVLDLGYLDVHELVRRLPEDFDLRVVGREAGAGGGTALRIAATVRAGARPKLREAWLLCDEETGMVTHIEVRADSMLGYERRLLMDYLGEEPPGLVDYRRPW